MATASAIGTTDAAVVYFDVSSNPTISDTGEFIMVGEINLGYGTYTLGATSAPEFALFFVGTNLYNGHGNQTVEWGLGGGSFVPNLTYGSTIDSLAITSWSNGYGYLVQGGSGYWVSGANAYAPLRIDQGGGNYNYGWVAIDYDTLGPTATITGFAFEDQVNTPIEAGAVPEPSTYALLALAGLFGAAVWHHRRYQRGASPALLQLAAGARGVAQLRADRKS